MDFATLLGLLFGLALVFGAIWWGGAVAIFINIPSLMIVVGGTLAAICVNFPLHEVWQAVLSVVKVFGRRRVTANDVVNVMVQVAEISRRDGLLALERVETDNKILQKACQLIADNADHRVIRDAVRFEIASMNRRHSNTQDVFKRAAMYAPSLGMIGTLIGLVQMLTNLNDPNTIGPSMAVALLTTFYGAFMSTMIFLPIAGKLRSISMEERLHLEIIFEGAKCILENNNPRLVYEKLSSFVPPKERRSVR